MKIYYVGCYNGMRWTKQCNANEYYTKDGATRELEVFQKVWKPNEIRHSVCYHEVDIDYVLDNGYTLPTPPNRTPWGTIIPKHIPWE
jgi:hypothetical protein